MTEFRNIAIHTRAAVICVSETWLDNSVTNTEIQIEGFNVIRKDRNRHGGGVATYIRSDLAFSERNDLQSINLESVWVEILLPKTKPILVGTCYRPPKDTFFSKTWKTA